MYIVTKAADNAMVELSGGRIYVSKDAALQACATERERLVALGRQQGREMGNLPSYIAACEAQAKSFIKVYEIKALDF